jgi:hypothetical protein
MDRVFDHPEFREHVDAYLVGALAGDERAAFEAHAAACPACAAVVAEAAAQDASLRDLFAGAAPTAGFEDRIVDRLRWVARPRVGSLLHPTVRRAATGVAAAVMLAGFGYVATQSIQNNGGLPVPWATAVERPGRPTTQHVNNAELDMLTNGVVNMAKAALTSEPPALGPREMAEHFARSIDADPQTNPWMYKQRRQGGEQQGEEVARAKRAPAVVGKPAATPPATSEPEVERRMEKESLDTAAKVTNGAVAPGKDQPVEAGDHFGAYRGYGVASGGFGGGGAKAAGFGWAAPTPGGGGGAEVARPGIGAGGKAPVEGRGNDLTYDANGRTPDGSVAVPGVVPNAALGLQNQQGQASAAAGGRPAQPAAGQGAFRPYDFYFAGDKTDAAKDVKLTKRGEAVDALAKSDSAPRDTKPEEVKQQVATSGGSGAAPQAQPGQAQPAPDPGQPATNPTAGRKIIRNGDMSFEVDSFDSAFVQITKIAQEEGGFVATTDSEKLANGKVKGTVTVRVPPDRLDTLVLKLRGLGDLKSSKLAAQDITKQYTDLESQLKAARAMEERLLNIIKTGKGEIKDLVEAEKQLGVYREKIEQVEGEVRYYNNLVSLSTLNVTLTERDIRTAALLSETEQVNLGVESQDVEKARASAIKAIEEAKGRIVESELKKLEAGQYAAKEVADVPTDAAGPLIDRMKQIGTVARREN